MHLDETFQTAAPVRDYDHTDEVQLSLYRKLEILNTAYLEAWSDMGRWVKEPATPEDWPAHVERLGAAQLTIMRFREDIRQVLEQLNKTRVR